MEGYTKDIYLLNGELGGGRKMYSGELLAIASQGDLSRSPPDHGVTRLW